MQIKAELTKLTTNKKGAILQIQLDEDETKSKWSTLYPLMYSFITIDIDIDQEREFEKIDRITEMQRRKIFALFREFAEQTGYSLDEVEQHLKDPFIDSRKIEDFSLSNCSRKTARDFIGFVVLQFILNDLPLKYDMVKDFTKTHEFMVVMNEKKKCCICGMDGETGRYNQKKITVCEKHKREFTSNSEDFIKNYCLQEYFNDDLNNDL